MKYLLILSFFLLTGCHTIYYHDYKSTADFEQDKYECETIAYSRSAAQGYGSNPFIVMDATKECLERKYGWRRVK